MRVTGRFDRFLLVDEPRGPAGGRLLNHPYRFASLPTFFAPLTLSLALAEREGPCWVFCHPLDEDIDAAPVERDLRGWGALHHPLLPRVLSNGRTRTHRWFATDVPLGVPLPLFLDEAGPLDALVLASFVHDFASAIGHAHNRNTHLTDLIVFDGTIDLDGRIHVHSRAAAFERNELREQQKHTTKNVAGWLARFVRPDTPPSVTTSLIRMKEGDGAGALDALSTVDLESARSRASRLLAEKLPDAHAIVARFRDEARGVSGREHIGLDEVVPTKSVRLKDGPPFYAPNSLA